jgi:hypothetical protein
MGLKWKSSLVVIDFFNAEGFIASSLLGRHNTTNLHSLHVNDDDDYDENTQGCKAFTAIQASTTLSGFYKRIPSPPNPSSLLHIKTQPQYFVIDQSNLQSISIQTKFKAFKAHKHHCYQSIHSTKNPSHPDS